MTNVSPASPPPSLYDYVAVIVKHRRLIAGVTLASTVISIIVVLLLPSIYTAKAMIIPSEDDKGVMGAMMAQLGGINGIAGITGAGLRPTKSDLYVTMLKSETLMDPIIDRFKLMNLYETKFRTDVYKLLDKNVTIKAGKKDGVITIAVDDKNPKRSADIANAYVEELGKLAARLSMNSAGSNREYLEERLSAARSDLGRAEDALKAFQSRNKAVSITDQAKASIEGIAGLRAQLAAQEVSLNTLRAQFTDTSQEVKTAKAAVSNLKAQISKMEAGGGASSSIPSIGNVPEIGQEYLRLVREFKTQETLVGLLTSQYEVAKLSESRDVAPFQVLQKAKVPERRSKPVRSKFVAIAFTLALVSSCAFVLVRDSVRE
ncbi:Wzz/FepE/Etk N-terminal domain-containing protein [Geobacter sp.]|uniref:GumC family protein n=1 Tax=Geobacter sp. TaxID=46610 RepID=UPI00262BA0FC|nr:Wzz/FepE/Etk N-terminal domain-containing protein [Geobacter sp.]